jgi:CubicO group peptidase (beta-lactamase class C family)
MHQRHRGTTIVLGLILAVLPGLALGTEPQWPDTELGRHVQAWFEQLHGTEAQARDFLTIHFDPAALAETPLDARLERRRGMLERTHGGLVPLEVLASTETTMQVRARDGNGEEPVVHFEAESVAPHRIRAVRLQLGGPGDAPPAPAGPPLGEAEAVQQIGATLDRAAQEGTFSGAVLLARNGKPVLRQAWGAGDRAKGTPLTPGTCFNLASIGKVPTKIAVAQLAQAGKLSLDDRLSKYLPDFPRAADITLEMLVEHRSGVGDIFNERYEAMDRSQLRHNRDYLELIRNQPLWFEPGTQQRYSNGGYVLLGEVIAKASGADYYDYLAANVFVPAGMKSTAALLEGDGTPGVARGYTRNGAPAGEERDNVATRPWRGSAAGGSYSTVDDLLALDQALLRARLCSPAWSAWVIGGPRPDRRTPAGSADLSAPGFAFAGGAPGISTAWEHEGDLTLVVLTNRDPEVSQPVVQSLGGILRRITH